MAIILATGDIAPDRADPAESFVAVAPLLRAADLAIGQLETSFAHNGSRLPQARHAVLAHPKGAAALGEAGFSVMSLAGNHCLDWGNEALLESMSHLRAAGIEPVGAGENIVAARKPVLRTLPDGSRVAILAYCSILPMGYWADARRPGCAPLRAHTLYEQIEHDQPGTPAQVHSFAHQADLAAMIDDIHAAKARADVVLVLMHWGIHFVRSVLADYQRELARAAIAAGADAIVGHHPHMMKGAELIDGKPVFYSIGNLAVDLRMDPAHAASPSFQEIRKLAPDWQVDFDSLYNFPPASSMATIARFEVENGRLVGSGLLPIWIGRDAVPRPLAEGTEQFVAITTYLREISAEAGLAARFKVEHGVIVMSEHGDNNDTV